MSMVMKLVSRFKGGNEQEVDASANQQRHLLSAQGNPSYMEVRRRGEGYHVQTAVLFAPLVAIPTVTAALEIYNNGKRLIVISDLHAMQVLTTNADETYGIFACVTTLKAVPSVSALAVTSLSGKPVITPTVESEVVTDINSTIVDNGWLPYGVPQSWGNGQALPGNSWSVPINGKLVLPPGVSLALHIVGALATASTFQVGASFDFVDAKMES